MEPLRAATTRHHHADQSVKILTNPHTMYLPHLPDGEGGEGAKGM